MKANFYFFSILTISFFFFLGFKNVVPSPKTFSYASNRNNLASSVTRYVRANGTGNGSSWANASGDLQLIINNSAAGDSVFVAAGTFVPALNSSFSMKEGVKIFGGFPATGNPIFDNRNWETNKTVLNPNNNNGEIKRVILNGRNGLTEAAVLDGFTINGGRLTNPEDQGAGMYNEDVSPMIRNCTFSDNKSESDGGGVYNKYGAPTFYNCTFSENASNYLHISPSNNYSGGAMVNYQSATKIGRCTFLNNTSGSNNLGGGGAIYNFESYGTIDSSTFSNNTTPTGRGGAIYSVRSNHDVTNSFFYNNHSALGGSFYGYGSNSEQKFTKCVFIGNTASKGGVVFNRDYFKTVFSQSIFSKNTAIGTNGNGAGGVVYNQRGLSVFTNCVLTANISQYNGAVIYSDGWSGSATKMNVELYNSVVYNNSGGILLASYFQSEANSATVKNSLVQDFTASAPNTFVYEDNLAASVNPLFADIDNPKGADSIWGTADDGLQLQACSPLINSGKNEFILGSLTDFRNQPRIQQGIVDIGAYESGFTGFSSTTVYVDSSIAVSGNGSSWIRAFKTLSEALFVVNNPCSDTKIIYIAKGTYYPTGKQNGTDRNASFILPQNGIKMYGGYPNGGVGSRSISSYPTILSGDIGSAGDSADNSHHVVVIANSAPTADSIIVDGLHIQQGNANGTGQFGYNGIQINQNLGGGIVAVQNSNIDGKIQFNNCSIQSNSATEAGGGIYLKQSMPSITNSGLSKNTSKNKGGGLYAIDCDTFSIMGLDINENRADTSGGGIYLYKSSPKIFASSIINNSSSYSGGGIIALEYSSPTIRDCQIIKNQSKLGAGIFNQNYSSAQIVNTTFKGNQSSDNGGAISCFYQSNIRCTNVLISGNIANFGGAIFNSESNPQLINTTVAGNYARLHGGAFFNRGSNTNMIIQNSIVSGNAAGQGSHVMNNDGGGIATVSFSLIGGASWESAYGVDGGNNRFGDPFFVNPKVPSATTNPNTDGNYAITFCSPAQNSGNNSFNTLEPKDILGKDRIYKSIIDMGAYELQSDLDSISILKPSTQRICLGSPTNPILFEASGEVCITLDENQSTTVIAPSGTVFSEVIFASYGTPTGDCTAGFAIGSCHSGTSKSFVESLALGRNSFDIAAVNTNFGDPCGGIVKRLYLKLRYQSSFSSISWINNNPGIGLPASGTGNIPSFTPVKSGVASIVATNTYGACTATTSFEYRVSGETVFVDSSVAVSGDGSSWTNAYKTIKEAFTYCPNLKTIYVAKGTYFPTDGTNRDSAFVLPMNGGIQIFGGYPSGGGKRDVTQYPTILSGDIGNRNDTSDNSHHIIVLSGINNTADSTIIDGFTIMNGNGKALGSFTYNGNTIPRNTGGGIALYQNSSTKITIRNCFITKNFAAKGAGVFNESSEPLIQNNFIQGNEAVDNGGGIGVLNSSQPILVNVLLSGNKANFGGALFNENSGTFIINCTVAGNFGRTGSGGIFNKNNSSQAHIANTVIFGNRHTSGILNIYNTQTGTLTVANSLIESGNGWNADFGIDEGNNLFYNPQFINWIVPTAGNTPNTQGNYNLKSSSPIINKGSNIYFDVSSNPDIHFIDSDLIGNPRIQSTFIDIGAYETSYSTSLIPDANGIIYVTESGNGTSFGDSWANATNDLQRAINTMGVQQIWVAGGTYLPIYRADNNNGDDPNDRNNAFVLNDGIKIYGSFGGTETTLQQRDSIVMANHPSVLSGDLGVPNDVSDNAYHVVISVGNLSTSLLNGFTIINGHADGDSQSSINVNGKNVFPHVGGGIYNVASSTTFSNLLIQNNKATNGAGIYNLSTNASFSNVKVQNNIADQNGGGVFNKNTTLSFVNSSIKNNEAANGGGIYNDSSTVQFSNTPFETNMAFHDGGGIYNNNTTGNFYGVPFLENSAINGGGAYNKNSTLVFSNSDFRQNEATYGAGIYNNLSTLTLVNLTVQLNRALQSGGGIYNESSSGNYINILFVKNAASQNGGGIYNLNSFPIITNNTIVENNATNMGGAIFNNGGTSIPVIRNSIIYGNNSGVVGTAGDYFYSLIQGKNGSDNNNIPDQDPKFMDVISGDYQLQNGSPAVNKGNKSYFSAEQTPDLSSISTDLGGHQRIQRFDIDLGAFESPYTFNLTPNADGIIFVKPNGTGTGQNWNDATSDLQKAINTTGVKQVWVAGGTYYPNYRPDNNSDANANDRNNSFLMKKNVKVFGSFAGTENSITERTFAVMVNNRSTLSGNIGNLNSNSDNAYHVVTIINCTETTVLDGFIIRDGTNIAASYSQIQVDGADIYITDGGGIFIHNSTSLLSNLNVRNNISFNGAGIYNNNSTPIFTNIVLSENNASYGGGMYNQSSSTILTNILFSKNKSRTGGGLLNYSSSPIITNATFYGNVASDHDWATYGGGIYNKSNSHPQIRNSIVYFNYAMYDPASIEPENDNLFTGIDNDGSSSSDISYSLVQGMLGTENGNIPETDPIFENTAAGDYHLKVGSPAINVGNKIYFNAGEEPDLSEIVYDLDGKQRIYGGKIDLGAYENQDAPVGISLLNFTAKAENKMAKIEWTTTSEINNKEFVLSRSSDGKDFEELIRVSGSGNATTQNNYSHFDKTPLSGINYYRLQQIDFDGKMTDYGIRKVVFEIEKLVIKVYPNPVRDQLAIEFPAGTYHRVEIINSNGKVMQQLNLNNWENRKIISFGNLATGVYFVKLIGKETVTQKVMKE